MPPITDHLDPNDFGYAKASYVGLSSTYPIDPAAADKERIFRVRVDADDTQQRHTMSIEFVVEARSWSEAIHEASVRAGYGCAGTSKAEIVAVQETKEMVATSLVEIAKELG